MRATFTMLTVIATAVFGAQTWTVQPGIIRPDTTSTSTIRLGARLRTYLMDRNAFVFVDSDDGRSLGRTTSTNVRGTEREGDPEAGIANPAVVQRGDGKFVLVYDASPVLRRPHLPRRLFARISDDGVSFGPATRLPVTDLDRNPRGEIFQSVPDLIRLPDGSLRLYYTAGGTAIGSMRSTDGGQTWTPDAGYRLGEARSAGPTRTAHVDPDVVLLADGTSLMYLAYSEFEARCGGLGCQVIRVATSKDGLTFAMEVGTLLGPTGSASGVVDPDVFQTADGRWSMLYGEIAGQAINLRLAIRTN